MEKYNTIDVAIDSWHALSGISVIDALWMGVPIIGMLPPPDPDKRPLPYLKYFGKEKWLAKNEREYIELCKQLANDETYRKSLKVTLRQEVIDNPLTDSKKYSENLYNCLKKIADDN